MNKLLNKKLIRMAVRVLRTKIVRRARNTGSKSPMMTRHRMVINVRRMTMKTAVRRRGVSLTSIKLWKIRKRKRKRKKVRMRAIRARNTRARMNLRGPLTINQTRSTRELIKLKRITIGTHHHFPMISPIPLTGLIGWGIPLASLSSRGPAIFIDDLKRTFKLSNNNYLSKQSYKTQFETIHYWLRTTKEI